MHEAASSAALGERLFRILGGPYFPGVLRLRIGCASRHRCYAQDDSLNLIGISNEGPKTACQALSWHSSVFQSKDEPEGDEKRREGDELLSGRLVKESSSSRWNKFGWERGNGARGKGAAFEPPCRAPFCRSLRRCGAT